MSDIISEFKYLNETDRELIKNVKILYIFYDWDDFEMCEMKNFNILFVTKEDKVYAVCSNKKVYSRLSLNDEIKKPNFLKELTNKRIIDFVHVKYDFVDVKYKVFARTKDGQIFSWRFPNKPINNEVFDIMKFEELKNEIIIDIRCGIKHIVALTDTGKIYAWGCNEYGQLGIGNNRGYEENPLKLVNFNFEKFIAISCGSYHTLALTQNGYVYVWGRNIYIQLGIVKNNIFRRKVFNGHANFPILLNFKSKTIVKTIACSRNHSLLLTSDGDIYALGLDYCQTVRKNKENISKINSREKYVDIVSHCYCDISVGLSRNDEYFIWGIIKKEKKFFEFRTNFKTFDHIFAVYFHMTHKPIHIFFTSEVVLSKIYPLKYVQDYKEISTIGHGQYGIVYKSERKIDSQFYAIKKIPVIKGKIENLLKEIKIVSSLPQTYAVKIESWWLEMYDDRFGDSLNTGTFIEKSHHSDRMMFYIQMELCDKTLKDIIEELAERISSNQTKLEYRICYFIQCELFIEILECVNYLHLNNPPIIHRDLKPTNILLKREDNGRFIKLSDFGIATFHVKDQSHTQDIGTPKYIAPEVWMSKYYDIRADIYSLGIILQELFNFDIDKSSKPILDNILNEKFSNLYELMKSMLSVQRKERPSCEFILEKKSEWALSFEEMKEDYEFQKFLNMILSDRQYNDGYIMYILQRKIRTSITHVPYNIHKNVSYNIMNLKNGRYNKTFEEIKLLTNSNKQVYKVLHKDDKKIYAIKKFIIFDMTDIDELLGNFKIMKRYNSEFVIEYESAWIEEFETNSETSKKQKHKSFFQGKREQFYLNFHLFVQMEPYYKSLEDISFQISEEKRKKEPKCSENYQALCYFVKIEIFKQIIEGLDFLHKQNPPIFHCMLNPSNIMITEGMSGRFVKIADYGFGSMIDFFERNQFYDKKYMDYVAPDFRIKNIDKNVDIYSAGKIANQIFGYENTNIQNGIEGDYGSIENLWEKMISYRNDERPNIENILKIIESLDIGIEKLELFFKNENGTQNTFDIELNFIEYFIVKLIENFKRKKETSMREKYFLDINIKHNYYKKHYREERFIGSGSFSVVFEAIKHDDGEIYAIKKIPISKNFNQIESVFKEFKMAVTLKSEFVVRYFDKWVEENDFLKSHSLRTENPIESSHKIFNYNFPYVLNIQMEFCSKTLRDLLEMREDDLNTLKKEIKSTVEFYIACELLKEIIECVNFLHEKKPAIIHRDLKPSNILITRGENGRFVKLGDFGLAVFHYNEEQTHTQGSGTYKYMAPEVIQTRNYNTKADIYSIGAMIPELFNFQLHNESTWLQSKDEILREKCNSILKILNDMLSTQERFRPDCREILKDVDSLELHIEHIKEAFNYEMIMQESQRLKNVDNFFMFFLQKKLKFLSII